MDEIWERAVETALDGQNDVASVRTLTLDGAVKCVQGRLPPPPLFEKFVNLNHLSIANIGVSSLEQFPRLRNLQKLILSDNRIAGGLEFLVEAGLESLRDLDLSNNRIQDIDDLRPLAELKLASLDLYESPVTRVKDYRSRVFGLVKSLRYLDKMDADGYERPESDDDEEESGDEEGEEDEGDDEENENEDEDEDDPGSGEIDGEDRSNRMSNGHSVENDGVVDVDEDEESDADEEETETVRSTVNGLNGHSNGFRVEPVGGQEDENEDDGEEEDEIDEEEDEDEDVIEIHEILDSDEEDDGVEDEDEDEEEVDNDEGDFVEPESTGRITSTEGEIDAHEQGEDDGDDEDDNGETEEEEMGVEEGNYEEEEEEEAEDEWQEDDDNGYLLQPVVQAEEDTHEGSDMDANEDEDDAELEEEVEDEEEEEEDDGEVQPSTSSHKRKRDEGESDGDSDSNEEDDEDNASKLSKSSKPH